MKAIIEALLNYFQQPPWTPAVSNPSNVLISGEAGNVIMTQRGSAAGPTTRAPQRCLNVQVALSLMSSRDKRRPQRGHLGIQKFWADSS